MPKSFDFKAIQKPQSISLPKGQYLVQLWGAGASFAHAGTPGKGAYCSGIIKIEKQTTFYIYVGNKGVDSYAPIFNGNTDSGSYNRGGGATDIRLVRGDNWYDFPSLLLRIIVAGAGGATERSKGGDAGLIGETYKEENGLISAGGGNQTHGGYTKGKINYGVGTEGKFGVGGSGICHGNTLNCDTGAGGGSGYFGGGGTTYYGSGGGGSSYISGYEHCKSVAESSTEDKIISIDTPFHYSGLYFVDGIIRGGNESMISPNGTIITGNTGDGYARITVITGSLLKCTKYIRVPSIGRNLLFCILCLIYS